MATLVKAPRSRAAAPRRLQSARRGVSPKSARPSKRSVNTKRRTLGVNPSLADGLDEFRKKKRALRGSRTAKSAIKRKVLDAEMDLYSRERKRGASHGVAEKKVKKS